MFRKTDAFFKKKLHYLELTGLKLDYIIYCVNSCIPGFYVIMPSMKTGSRRSAVGI